MASTVRRAVGFAFVGSFALLVPVFVAWGELRTIVGLIPIGSVLDPVQAMTIVVSIPFLAVTALSLITTHGRLFDLFAFPADHEEGRLYGLASFCFVTAGLTVFALQFELSLPAFVASVFLLVYGNLAEKAARQSMTDPFVLTTVFAGAAFCMGIIGQVLTMSILGTSLSLSLVVFLGASGSLLAALLRSMLFDRDDPIVLLSVAFALWLFADLPISLDRIHVVGGLCLSLVFGYLSYALETASVTGMLSGVLLALLTVALGDYGWFAVLISFFVVGGLSTKFRYESKRHRGLAQENEGARGSGNVLANSAVALIAVIGAAAHTTLGIPESVFLFAFTGAIAAAMSDTLSSEIGGLFGPPRLITTMRPVKPGTDGGVTWQGFAAGVGGAAIVATITVVFFDITAPGAGVVVLAGVVGMTVDSLLGATVEGPLLDNMAVNFLATLSAALVAVGTSLGTGVVVL
ncbi:DUF92 domain-containing protein [Halocatena pleomorpha]|uniref:DUF92 domain-containing protein n=1 Tax=Halocatena pleomorpha TaxID=1785090 RepID=A0A3P3R3W7_9EURY|nr:DUF92 domain-containing protein [Halocatena pleomorpha]RRJ28167.1 DUF92 domain-containing protein [Halocatena pleomorpha]